VWNALFARFLSPYRRVIVSFRLPLCNFCRCALWCVLVLLYWPLHLSATKLMFLSTQICIHVHSGTRITCHIIYSFTVHTKPCPTLSHIARYTTFSVRYIELPDRNIYPKKIPYVEFRTLPTQRQILRSLQSIYIVSTKLFLKGIILGWNSGTFSSYYDS
jgi:hypothetical protein